MLANFIQKETIKNFILIFKNNLIDLKERLFDEITPKFWRKVRNLCAGLSAAGSTVFAKPEIYPTIIQENAAILVSAGLVGTVLSQLTKKREKE